MGGKTSKPKRVRVHFSIDQELFDRMKKVDGKMEKLTPPTSLSWSKIVNEGLKITVKDAERALEKGGALNPEE